MKIVILIISTIIGYFLLTSNKAIMPSNKDQGVKIKGVNLVSPRSLPSKSEFKTLNKLQAKWVALTPYAFMNVDDPKIYYNIDKCWWGDHMENVKKMVQLGRDQHLNILLKPHFWVESQGWPGDYNLSRSKWKEWEKNYHNYMMQYAKLAEELNIEILSIGVEFKTAIKKRNRFWSRLIDDIRTVYNGQLIYAANWDNYQNVKFWDKLDFVGIDAYFPLSPSSTPSIKELNAAWKPVLKEIDQFYKSVKKPIIFTEYGYRSSNKAAWRQWEIENIPSNEQLNLLAQTNAYKAFYQSVWHKDWFAGGFIWKCYAEDTAGGRSNSNYTPQNKPAQFIIEEWYSKH